MKIVPIDSGEPVDVLTLNGGSGAWDLFVSCDGNRHRLSLTQNREITIYDHSAEEIEYHETLAKLGDVNSACPCVRVKVWLAKGIDLIEIFT
jgi:hypothetical protein